MGLEFLSCDGNHNPNTMILQYCFKTYQKSN